MSGRGSGKTRTAVEWVREQIEQRGKMLGAFVARTAADVRDTMVEGESGILAKSDPSWRPIYEPSKRRLTWPNGARVTCFSAEEPNLLRGPQYEFGWCDELAAWNNLNAAREDNPWDQLQFGLRLGTHPQCIVTTTPRPKRKLREILSLPSTVVTRASTYDNAANLSPMFIEAIKRNYEGTTVGRQELYGELLDELPGALWQRCHIDETRVDVAPHLSRIVVAIDPAVTNTEDSDETGIVLAGIDSRNPEHYYVLADLTRRASPDGWARVAIQAYHDYKADRIVAETNNGGEMVEHTLRSIDNAIPYTAVHASRGKRTRAEPISAIYEQRRVHHVGLHPELEDQMVNWIPGDGDSPDRIDALVWAMSELSGNSVPLVKPIFIEGAAWHRA